jgi:hypothetical protein
MFRALCTCTGFASNLRLPRIHPGGSDRLPLNCFRLQDQRFTVRGRSPRAVSGGPSTGRTHGFRSGAFWPMFCKLAAASASKVDREWLCLKLDSCPLTLTTAEAGGFLGRTRRTRHATQRLDAVTGLHVRWNLGRRFRSTGVDFRRPCGMQAVWHRREETAIPPHA